MQSISQPSVPHVITSAGVDWITATASGSDTKQMQDALSMNEFDRARDRGEKIKPITRFGYVGYASDNYFHGHNENGRIIVVSGARASDLFNSVVEVSDNIARLDVQVTISTGSDRPHIARQAFAALSSKTPASVRVRNSTLIENRPEGETLNVGKRSSDWYGRIYDKGAEARSAEALSLWRWELEVKRNPASRIAGYIRGSHSLEAASSEVVYSYFNRRGLQPPWKPLPVSSTLEPSQSPRSRDTLQWFRDTLSKTVARMVAEHGREQVLDALGLSSHVNPN